MPTTAELAEAQAWTRRRLAAVLVAGPDALDGQEPTRPGRAVVAGGVLAALVAGGLVVLGLLRGPSPAPVGAEPLVPGVAVAEETGAVYVLLETDDGLLARPALNPASARLLVEGGPTGPPQAAPAAVLADLSATVPGPALGIADAPASLPAAGDLLTGAWLACPGDDAPAPVLGSPPAEPLGPGTALLVQPVPGGPAFLVVDAGDGARRYPLPADPSAAQARLAALGAPPLATARAVPASWLALVPPGDAASLPPIAVRREPACLRLDPVVGAVPGLAPAPSEDDGDQGTARVPPGAGALVTTQERRRAWFVDDRARLLPVVGDQARERLGWAEVEPVVLPTAWLALLDPGPVLSVRAAAQPTTLPLPPAPARPATPGEAGAAVGPRTLSPTGSPSSSGRAHEQ